MFLLTNKIAQGDLEARFLLTSSRVIPLRKKGKEKVRHIAAGEILYRIAGRAISRSVSAELQKYQFGAGTPCGVEPVLELVKRAGKEKLSSELIWLTLSTQ